MLKLTNITKDYVSGDSVVHALKGVSLEFRENEFVSILGQSGCGKTTLLNIIGGLDKYTDGDLIINSKSTKNFNDRDWDTYRNHSVGFIFQSYNLIPHQTVLSNVELALTLSGVPAKERRERAKQALIKVGLGDQINKKPNQMSGGQMQRVAIARALVNDPEILLADEPTGALDSETSVQIMDLIKEIANDRLVIMVTHNPELAEEYSTRIINLLDGNVISDSNPYDSSEEVSKNEKNESPCVQNGEQNASEAVLTAEGGENEQNSDTSADKKKNNDGKTKKTSMSFFTAFLLSLNNLLTKKGRTILTSFAGSIGIIGIALIFAVSNGTNAYINHVQESTLSSYPLTIESESVDLSSLIFTLLNSGSDDSKNEDRDQNAVYKDELIAELLTALGETKVTKNDLKAFKEYIDSELAKKEDSDLYKALSEVQYKYNLNFSVYTENADGKIIKSDTNDLLQEMLIEYLIRTGAIANSGSSGSATGGSSSSMISMGSSSMWQEILADSKNNGAISDVVKDQYEFIDGGRWPTKADEIVLVVNEDNELDDLTLYALGLLKKEDIDSIIDTAVENTNKINSDSSNTSTNTNTSTNESNKDEPSWSFDEIKARTYKVILPSHFYVVYDGKVVDKSGDETFLTTLYNDPSKTIDLKVTGIIRLKDDADQGYMKGSIGYTSLLTEHIINESSKLTDKNGNPTIVGLQMQNPSFDVFTGLPFKEASSNLSNEEKVNIFKSYVGALPNSEKAKLYVEISYLNALNEMVEDTTTEQANDKVTKLELETKKELLKITDKKSAISYISNLMLGALSDEEREALTEAVRSLYDTQNGEGSFDNLPQYSLIPTQTSKQSLLANALATQLNLASQEEGTLISLAQSMAPEVAKATIQATVDFGLALSYPTTQSKANALTDHINEVLGGEDKAKANATIALYYDELMKFSTSSYEENLIKLGRIDLDTPTSINLFASTFEQKDDIKAIIDKYNSQFTIESGKQIKYSDIVGDMMKGITTIINAITYVLIAFVATSLIVSSIMIGVITLISVQERTKEIGVLRAMGASKGDVSRVFNAETLIVGFTSGLLGILVTLLLTVIINIILFALTGIAGLQATLGFWPAIILIAISMGLTLIAGLIPSRVAAKKDPVIALRSE